MEWISVKDRLTIKEELQKRADKIIDENKWLFDFKRGRCCGCNESLHLAVNKLSSLNIDKEWADLCSEHVQGCTPTVGGLKMIINE